MSDSKNPKQDTCPDVTRECNEGDGEPINTEAVNDRTVEDIQKEYDRKYPPLNFKLLNLPKEKAEFDWAAYNGLQREKS